MKWTDGVRALVIVCLTLAAAQASNLVQPAGKSFAPGLATDGGPDAWGYRYVDNDTSGSVPGKPTYNWMDIRSNGTRVTGLSDDNIVGPFQVGFVFPLYWQRYTEFYVGSNGYLTFDDYANSAHPFPDVPAAQRPNNVIAPLMADLDFTGLTGNRGCWYWTNAACDTFVLQCESIPFWSVPGSWNSFEIILSKNDSAIALQYRVQVGAPNGTTPGWRAGNDVVGIENITGLTGLRYLYGATPSWNNLHSGLAVRFYPPATSSYQFADIWAKYAMSDNSGGIFLIPYQPTNVWARFKNAGNQSESNVPVSAEIRQGNNAPIFQWSGSIPNMPVGYETTLTFGRCSLTTTNTYTLKVKSGLSGDQYHTNDSILIEIRVVNYSAPPLLAYDVGTAGGVALRGFHGYAVRFIPPEYPTLLDTALFYFTGSMDPETVKVFDDNGPHGSPGTLLGQVAWTPGSINSWSHCYLGGLNINIRSGGFYLGYTKSMGSMLLGTDTLLPHSRQNWEYTGAWAPMRTNEFTDLKIRARVKQGSSSHNVGVIEVPAPAGLLDSGQAVTPQARIRNFGYYTENPNVTFIIPSTPSYLQTVNIAGLAPNQDTLVVFPVWSARPGFGLIPRCSVYVTGDVEPQNDTLSGAPFNVRYIDLGAVSVDRPRDTIELGATVIPRATVRNYGNTAENVVARFSVPGTAYNQTQTLYLGVGATDTVAYPAWTPPAGGYTGRCSTEHALDMYSPNDVASAPFFVRHRDVACSQILVPADTVDLGQTLTPQAYVRNDGNTPVTFDVRFNIQDGYTNTQTVSGLAPAENRLISFGPWTPGTTGGFNLRCSTRLNGDQANNNDRCTGSVFVRHLDVACTQIPVPTDTVDLGQSVNPQAYVRNYGNTPVTFDVRFDIEDGYTNTQTVSSLAPAENRLISFEPWTPSAPGGFNLRCSTRLDGDQANNNDRCSGSVFVHLRDVQTVGFINPSGTTVDSGVQVIPEVSVRNNGSQVEGFRVRLTNAVDGYSSSESVYVAPNVTVNVSFDPWIPTRRNFNVLKCSTRLDGDAVHANDFATKTVRVQVYDADAHAILAPTGDSVTPGPLAPSATVHNYGNVASQVPVRFDIYKINPGGDSLAYTSSGSVLVSAGADGNITFGQWNATFGSWRARLTAILVGDMNPVNDTLSNTFFVFEPGHDVGAIAVLAPVWIVDTLSKTPQVRVKNFGPYTEAFRVYYQITDVDSTGAAVYRDSALAGPLDPGLTADVSCPNWTGHHWQGHYTTQCWTAMPGDANRANDTTRGTFRVLAVITDVGVTSIDVPVASVDSGVTATPSVTVHNYGNSAATFDVTVGINVSPAYLSTVTVTGVASGADAIVNTFVPWPAIQRGNWTVKCTTSLAGDLENGNDTATKAVAVNVHDLGAVAIVVPTGAMPPIAFTPKASVHNYGTLREPCTVTFMINSIPPYVNNRSFYGLPPGVDTVVDFIDATLAPGSYTAKCSTYLATDQVPGNEVVTVGFQVGTIDVSVKSILAPLYELDTTVVITPSALVTNPGSLSASFPVRFTISNGSDAIVYTGDTAVYSLAGGDSTTVTFPAWAKPHVPGFYTEKCSTMLVGDATPGNDAATGAFDITAPGGGSGWTQMTDVMVNAKNKRVKDGAALAYAPGTLTDWVYALKGNNTYEFYCYDAGTNTWASRDSIPAYNRNLRKKGVKKGSSLTCAGDGKLYATKGNNSLDFWQYDPGKPDGSHWTEMVNEVPAGSKNCKQGTSMASATIDGANYIYFLKGSGTYEFYRYDVAAGTWDLTLPTAPRGASGKPYKNGSSIAYDGGDTIYCLKGTCNEFFGYSISNQNWVTLDTLPKKAPPGTKKTKVKDGSQIAVAGRTVYALKGNNTNEFWTYPCDSHCWSHGTDMPAFAKKVRGGGALVAAPDGHDLYAFRGNNTLEFWKYTTGSFDMLLAGNQTPKDVMGQSAVRTSQFALNIAPNPFAGAAHINYSVPKAGDVSLRLYDVTGELVTTLVSGYHPAGSYSHSLLTTHYSLARGIYLLKYEAAGERTTQKLIIE